MTKRYNRVMNVAMTKKQLLNCVDQMNSGLLITDENGVIKYFNNAYLQLTKLSGLEIGDNIMTYYHQGIIKSKPACIEAIHSENKIIRQFTQSEDGVFIISSSETIKSDDGKIAFVITRVHDMTDFFEVRDDIENVRRIMEKLAQNDVEMNSQYGTDIIAINADFRQLLERGEKVAIFDVPVLITGESGTGKDVMARFIHDHSHRKEKAFVAINCAAIPDNLLETELFGYTKGTFTGQSKEGKAGLFEAARGGTLFLDEIGDMPLALQAKLLRVLESKTYMQVGGSKVIETDVRIIAATNHHLKEMIDEGKFREDLYYRINVVELALPSLRKRKEDIIPLSFLFLNKFNNKYGQNKRISATILQQLQSYDWPGNIRQLKNTIEMMCVLSSGGELEVPEFVSEIHVKDNKSIQAVREHILEIETTDTLLKLEDFTDMAEKEYLLKAYKICKTTRKMAEILGVNHSTIIRKMKKYKISAKLQP